MRAIIQDDYPVITMAINLILRQHGFDRVDIYTNAEDVRALSKEQDVELVDLGVWTNDSFTGGSLAEYISECCDHASICFLDNEEHPYEALAVYEKGYAGWISRRWSLQQIEKAIADILDGRRAFSEHTKTQGDLLVSALSTRELEVFSLLGKGVHRDDDIAETLFISSPTVRSHIRSLTRKLNMPNKNSLLQYATAHRRF